MLQKLKARKNFLIATFRKKSLRRNVLFLSLSGVVLAFLVMIITAPTFLYFIQSPKLSPDVMQELYQVSNAEDFMVAVTAEGYVDKFSDVTVVSAKDYVMSMDSNPNETFVAMTEEFIDNLNYQTQSSRYKAVKETEKIFFDAAL